MDSPPQLVVILFGALIVCLGPVLLTGGILAYAGRWTNWVGPSSYPSTAKHSRFGFVVFWSGLPLTAMDVLLAWESLGMDAGAAMDLVQPAVVSCAFVVLIHAYFLPRFLRPVLLPRWYRDWEAAQFEVEEREAAKRRARRTRRREKRRKAKELARS